MAKAKTYTWPTCQWNPVNETLHTKGPGRKHNCKRLASYSLGSRRPYIAACEVCQRTSKKLGRFRRSNGRIAGMTYVITNQKTGEVQTINLQRPEAQIAGETEAAGMHY